MEAMQIPTQKAQQTDSAELMRQLGATLQGLTSDEARRRRERFGANEIPEKHASVLVKFLGYLWGPIPWMIEAAAILSLLARHWADLAIILVLLLFNAAVGFWQEYQAGNAVAALRKKLALKSRVRRQGTWHIIDAGELVPGDNLAIAREISGELGLGRNIQAADRLLEDDSARQFTAGHQEPPQEDKEAQGQNPIGQEVGEPMGFDSAAVIHAMGLEVGDQPGIVFRKRL